MDLDQYFSEIVDPTIADFEENPSRRHAFLACVATFHAIDYLVVSKPKPGKGNLRDQLRKASSEFAIVDRVAHAFKHVRTGRPNAPLNQPLTSAEVISRPPAFWGTAVWGLSRWDDTKGGVTLAGKHDVDLLLATKRAAQFIRQQANTSG